MSIKYNVQKYIQVVYNAYVLIVYTMRLFCPVDDGSALLPPGGQFFPSRHADCWPGCPLPLALSVRTL